MHGGAGPWWASVLMAAEDWGCPPWEIAGGDKLSWFYRWTEYRNALAQRDRLEEARMRSKHG